MPDEPETPELAEYTIDTAAGPIVVQLSSADAEQRGLKGGKAKSAPAKPKTTQK